MSEQQPLEMPRDWRLDLRYRARDLYEDHEIHILQGTAAIAGIMLVLNVDSRFHFVSNLVEAVSRSLSDRFQDLSGQSL